MVISTAQLHSTKPELKFCAGSNPARGVSEVRDGEDLWQWSRLEIRLNTILRSTIPQKQFIIIIIIIMHIVFLRKMFFKKNLEHLDSLHSWTYNGFLLNLKSVKKLLRKKLMGKITDWFLQIFQLSGLPLHTTLYNYHIYLLIHLFLICNLALTKLCTYLELYYAKSKKNPT